MGARPPSRSRTDPDGATLRPLALGSIQTGWIVTLAALAAHGSSLTNGFTGDDHPAVLLNRLVTGPLDLPAIWGTNYWWGFDQQSDVLYRPITVLVHHIVHLLGGGSALIHHFVNLALHLLVALACATGLASATATAAGVLFAVHPVASEAVNSVVGRAGLLVALLALEAARQHRRVGVGSAPCSPVYCWAVLASPRGRRCR